ARRALARDEAVLLAAGRLRRAAHDLAATLLRHQGFDLCGDAADVLAVVRRLVAWARCIDLCLCGAAFGIAVDLGLGTSGPRKSCGDGDRAGREREPPWDVNDSHQETSAAPDWYPSSVLVGLRTAKSL